MWLSGAGCGRFGAVICSLYSWRLRLKLSQEVLCSSSGSHNGFHETFTISLLRDLKIRSFFSFLLRLTQAGQAHVSLVSIASRSMAL